MAEPTVWHSSWRQERTSRVKHTYMWISYFETAPVAPVCLTGVAIQTARYNRTRVHIQADTRTLNLHWGLLQPHICWLYRQDLIPVGNPRSHARGGPSPHTV